MSGTSYLLPRRQAGGAVLGLTPVQLSLLAAGTGALATSVGLWGAAGAAPGTALSLLATGLALVAVAGQPLHHLLAVALSYTLHRPHHHQPQPGGQHAGRLPLAGAIDLLAVPDHRTNQPVGVALCRTTRTATVAVAVRGGPFALLDPTGQQHLLAGWARVLAQTARDRGVVRLGWTLTTRPADPTAWTADLPDPPADPTDRLPPAVADGLPAGVADATASYRRLLVHAAAASQEHDLLLWLTVDPRRLPRRTDPTHLAAAAGQGFAGRCHTTGLHVTGVLDHDALHRTLATRLDPHRSTDRPPVLDPASLAARLGLAASAPTAPAGSWLDQAVVDVRWDAVRVGDSWHRVFWAAQPPAAHLHTTWLDPLLHDSVGIRTLALTAQPVPARTSRRRINADTVSLDTALALRDKHAFRVPAHLADAHHDVDRRDAEIHAGYPEYAWTLLLAVTAPDRTTLDDHTTHLADTAARCGLDQLVPLHGRHPAALAATLPLGQPPRTSRTLGAHR